MGSCDVCGVGPSQVTMISHVTEGLTDPVLPLRPGLCIVQLRYSPPTHSRVRPFSTPSQ
jgi:hypothetical protein